MPTVRPATDDDLDACVEIVRALPDYFTPDVPDKVREDWGRSTPWVATERDRVIGMAMVERRSPKTAEILWAAVEPARRGDGVGTALVESVVAELRRRGVRLVEVKTLDERAGYEPYVATRAFWRSRGFITIDVIDPLPGWPPGNPCALCVRPLDR